MSSLEKVQEMFASMRENTEWDVDGPLLWGYFFTDHDESRLEQFADTLAGRGYEVIEIFETEEDDMVLHVERVEHHTPDSLHARNLELAKLVQASGVEAYDGFDVGLPDDVDSRDDEPDDDDVEDDDEDLD